MDDQSRSRTVILLRHAKSSWSDSTLADIDRPLAPRGERAARKLAKYIRRKRIRPALVLCSPALRTRETLEAVEASLGKRCVVEVVPQLYAASDRELLELLQALPEPVSSVMLVGHNPGLQNLALVLASGVLIYRSSRRSSRPVRLPRSSFPARVGVP